MSSCKIDHSREDVLQKFSSQQEYLPQKLAVDVESLLNRELHQETLNEVFHLLKKYDLTSQEEQQERNDRLNGMIMNKKTEF
ncbi:hypothetical protein [Metabacillus sp. RGM 3146]|uniref:hypothetical protein n=1 Tax=Metabacillus sp. RGM 3146 TaxID=3401092 RepID=UPI003B9B92E8